MSQSIAISLLVCTRNRAQALPGLLTSIERAAASRPNPSIEVVIVDNGSSDATPSLLAAWCAAQPFPTRILREEFPGLARARNRGLAAVHGAIIAMTDDDCVLHDDYFDALFQAFTEASAPVIIGGRILLGNPADLPVTIKLEDHPMEADPLAFPGGFVMGANLAFTRCVLNRIGSFDERFGAGAPFVAAEDTDFLYRASGQGITLRYDPRFVVDHHHGRRTIAEETRLLAGYSYGDGALYAKHLTDRRTLAALATDIADLARDIRRPVTAHRGVRHFYCFRLKHKLRGALAFARHQIQGRSQRS
ncbi:glycosyltransferase [Sphingomonas sp.]|uniref:glycosyltransferase family 2 protein n=1 Tax=Sphingomonas sp. TaxID=28214 RepID=UPI0028A94C2D|nr:glycosyltransferase [Sphingomonas sp.]